MLAIKLSALASLSPFLVLVIVCIISSALSQVDILLINPPSSISERYGKEDMGEVGGDLIPLGMASLAAYIREKGFGVGALDCPTLRIDNERVYQIILEKNPDL